MDLHLCPLPTPSTSEIVLNEKGSGVFTKICISTAPWIAYGIFYMTT